MRDALEYIEAATMWLLIGGVIVGNVILLGN